ncbi:MAG: methionine--tRNA ligase [Nitrosomonadales bacterium]|jgi:methionyl-tRNA synthetase|nr:methionine--tRNA ligase [Nitrosomonadales bacterium]
MRKLLVTSALPYANGSIHLGHLVEYIQTDIWVRFQKMSGNETYYICADDTHGTPIMLKAEEENISPDDLVNKVHDEHDNDFKEFNVNFDHFYSTNSPENKKLSESIYNTLKENNKISSKEIDQFYDESKAMFLPDRFIKGSCPKCEAEDQYGDSCEKCGATYSPTELKNPYSVLSGTEPIRKKTLHYFFKLSECEEFLKEWIKNETLQPEAENKLKEWFDMGLQDWDISRDAPYFGFEIPDAPGKYFYVWLDAPIGYMASFKKFAQMNNLSFDEFWNKDSTAELIHFIGKDILYFHALFWPATLNYANYRTPSKIFTHGFLTVNGEKMSKSRGTFITARSYLDHIKDPNFLRYYYATKLNSSMEDLDLNLDDFIAKNNSDLIGKFINIPSRTSGFVSKFFNFELMPLASIKSKDALALLEKIKESKKIIETYYEAREFSKLVKVIMQLVENVNEYISKTEPWKLSKDEVQLKSNSSLHEICSVCLKSFRMISIFLSPIIPSLSEKIAMFYGEASFNSFALIEGDVLKIEPYKHLLKRIEQESIDLMLSSNKES